MEHNKLTMINWHTSTPPQAPFFASIHLKSIDHT